MKIGILLLLGLSCLAAAAPQSRFGPGRHQAGAAAAAADSSEAAVVAEVVEDSADGDTDDADLDAAGPDAGNDDAKDATGTSAADSEDKRPAYGLDAAKERRRLANLRKRFRPGSLAEEDSSVTDSPDEDGEADEVSEGNEDESVPESDGAPSPPVSRFNRRSKTQPSSSSVHSGASEDNSEEVASDSGNESTHVGRTPPLRRRPQTAAVSSDDEAQDEPSDASEGADSEGSADNQEPAAGTRTPGSLEERLKRYRQRQAGRLGAASQTDAGTSSDVAPVKGTEADETSDADATEDSPGTDEDSKKSGE